MATARPHRPQTGVPSFDQFSFAGRPSIGATYPYRDGFGAVHQPHSSHAVEMDVPAVPDHAVFVVLHEELVGEARIDGPLRAVRANRWDVGVLPAMAPRFWRIEPGRHHVFHMHISPDRIARMLGDEHPGDTLALVPHFPTRDEIIARIARDWLIELRQPGLASHCLAESYALALAVRLIRRHSNRDVASPKTHAIAPYRLRRALEYIETHLADDIGLMDIAGAAGLSTFHFSRVFKLETGVSPHRHLTERRIERAKTLLNQTDSTLVDIAFACGFGSQAHFTTAFKSITGATPAQWRQQWLI